GPVRTTRRARGGDRAALAVRGVAPRRLRGGRGDDPRVTRGDRPAFRGRPREAWLPAADRAPDPALAAGRETQPPFPRSCRRGRPSRLRGASCRPFLEAP